MAFYDRLKESRIKSGLTQEQLAEKLGIAKSTLSGYESGNREPTVATIAKVMDILNIDANYLYQDETNSLTELVVSLDEKALLKKYRDLDSHGREIVDLVLEKEHERYITALKEKPAAIRMYTYLRKIAAAGSGFYFDDIPSETIEAPYMPGADFIVGVNGDSMEPTYSDGDLVYVEKRQILNVGEIGIFTIRNECYIKEVGEDGLLSHNPKYKPIPGTEDIHCVGKVLGKVNITT